MIISRLSLSLRSLALSKMDEDMSCEIEEESVDPLTEGPIEFCVVCGVSYEDKKEGCEFCESKLDEPSPKKMEED